MKTTDQIRADIENSERKTCNLKDELRRAEAARPEVVQDYAYWLSIYPDGNFPLGALD